MFDCPARINTFTGSAENEWFPHNERHAQKRSRFIAALSVGSDAGCASA
jgi:hypothetical protein